MAAQLGVEVAAQDRLDIRSGYDIREFPRVPEAVGRGEQG